MTEQALPEESIFAEAMEIESLAEREAFLARACDGNPSLRAEVESLLRADQRSGDLLDLPETRAAAAFPWPVAEQPGTIIGRYKLLEMIAEGGMGIVYMAEQREPVRRKVALKIIKPGMDTRQVIARFEAERQVLALMDHPNVARVFDAGATESGRPYFVMEFVDGPPLTDYCDQKQLAARGRLELFVQVCLTVQYAHQKGVIHRDIKPSNVLVAIYDGLPVPKVIDFGIAKAVHSQPGEAALTTGLGLMIGTPLYMSPEQAGTRDLNVDTRSDIYSLGVMLYELLTGSTPFDQERVKQAGYDDIRRMIREEEPPPPSSRISTLGAAVAATVSTCRQTEPARLGRLLRGDLDWIVMRALDKDPAHRYQTANDLAQDIQHHLADEPISARPPTLFDRAAKWSRRHRPLVGSAVALLFFFAVGSLISTLLIAGAYREKNQQLTATKNAEELATQQEGLAKNQERLAREQERLAKEQKIEAQRERDVATRNLYLAQVGLARQDLGSGQVLRLHEILDSYLPRQGQPDLRGWEWYYLLSQCHGELLTFRGHIGWASALAWSPDGRQIASSAGGGDCTIKIWDPVTGNEARTLRSQGDTIRWLVWGPDGGQLTAAIGNSIRVWNVSTGEVVRTLASYADPVVAAAWSPNRRHLAAEGADGTIRILDRATGEATLVLKDRYTENQSNRALAWSPDGRQLASVSKHVVTIWDASTGGELRMLGGHKGAISRVVWSPDGRRLASASGDGFEVKVWDAVTGQELVSLKGLDSSALDLAWSPDGRHLASGGYSGSVKISDAGTGGLIRTLLGHTLQVDVVAWSPNGQRVASASRDGTVRVWDATVEPEASVLRGRVRSISGVAWSPDGRRLIGGGDEGRVEIWNVSTRQSVRTWRAHTGTCSTVAWSADGKLIASASEAGEIKLWDPGTGQELRKLEGHLGRVRVLCWSPDGRWLSSGGEDTTIRIWDVAAGKETRALRVHTAPVHALAWRHDGGRIASGAVDRGDPIRIWEADSGQNVLTLKHMDDVDYVCGPVAWSPDGRWVASAGRVIEVWNAADGQLAFRLYAQNGTVNALAWHPHGNRLASAVVDHTIKIWDLDTRQEILTLHPHTAWAAASLAWSSDGTRLAVANNDEVRIWDASVGYRMTAGPEYEYDRYFRLAAQGRNQEALVILERLAADLGDRPQYCPALAEAFFRRGRDAFNAGDHERALPDFDRAIQFNSEHADAYDYRAHIYLHDKGDLDRAIADCTKAIQFAPDGSHPYSKRGQAYIRKGRHDEALADFTEAIRLEPRNYYYYVDRGKAYFGKALFAEARADFTEALRLEPADPSGASRLLVELDMEKGDYDRGIADSSEAVQRAPQDPSFWYSCVLAPLAAGRLDDYRKALAEVVQRLGKSEDPVAIRVVSWACVIKPDSAADWLNMLSLAERAAQGFPGDTDLLAPQGALLYRAGSNERAIERLSEADHLIRDPSEIAAHSPAYTWFFLAMAHKRLGHLAEARKWLDKAGQWTDLSTRDLQRGVVPREYFSWERRLALRILRQEAEMLLGVKAAPLVNPPPPQSADSHRKRGRELSEKGDLDGAIAAYQVAISFFQATGCRKEAKAASKEAITILKTLAKKLPEMPEYQRELAICYVNLSDLYRATGQSKEAEAAFMEALTIRTFLVERHPEVLEYQHALANGHFSVGVRYFEAGKLVEAEAAWKQALVIWKTLVVKHPYSTVFQDAFARTHNNLLVIYGRAGREKEVTAASLSAISVLQSTKENQPNSPVFRLILSRAYYYAACSYAQSLGETNGHAGTAADHSATSADTLMKKAFECLQQACDAGCFDNRGDFDRMKYESDLDVLRDRPEYKKLLERIATRNRFDINPRDFPPKVDPADVSRAEALASRAEALASRGSTHFDRGEFDKAGADLREALRLDPGCARSFFTRAEALLAKKHPELAIPEYQKAARLDPEYIGFYLVHAGMARPERAKLEPILVELRQLLLLRTATDPACLRWLSCWLPDAMRYMEKQPGVVFASDMPWVKSTCGYGPPQAVRDHWLTGDPHLIAASSDPLPIAGLPYSKGIGTHAFVGDKPADVVLDISGQTFTAFKTHAGLLDHGGVRFQVLVDGMVKHQTPVMRWGEAEPISVDVAGAKEIVLRVLNDGGSGNSCDSVGWGYARFIEAGAEDPLEEPPAELRSATDADAALLLAEVNMRLGSKDLARRWFDKAAAWMEKNKKEAEKLRTIRAEVEKLVGTAEKTIPATHEKAKTEVARPKT